VVKTVQTLIALHQKLLDHLIHSIHCVRQLVCGWLDPCNLLYLWFRKQTVPVSFIGTERVFLKQIEGQAGGADRAPESPSGPVPGDGKAA